MKTTGGYQPDCKNPLNPQNPPQGGSGVPPLSPLQVVIEALEGWPHYKKGSFQANVPLKEAKA